MLHVIEPIQILTGCNTYLNHSTQHCCVESTCFFFYNLFCRLSSVQFLFDCRFWYWISASVVFVIL